MVTTGGPAPHRVLRKRFLPLRKRRRTTRYGIYYGKHTGPDGDVYEGQWRDGKLHGQGKLTSLSGEVVYEGEWRDGKFHGQGKMKWSNGRVYEGEFQDGKRHGQGKMT